VQHSNGALCHNVASREAGRKRPIRDGRRRWRSATRACEDENPRLACEKMRTHLMRRVVRKDAFRGGPRR